MSQNVVALSQAPGATEAEYTDFVHTGPGTLAGRYMRSFWQPVYIASELPAGRAIPIRIMSEDFTLYRGETGTPHVIAPRCPHRGALLHTGWVQGDQLRCFYHGWKFGEDGRCVERPAEDNRIPPQAHIRSYPTKEYLGLIFVYFGDGQAPELPRYPEMEREGVLDITMYTRLCNYFNNVENNVDPAHTPFTHSVSGYTDQGLVGIPDVSGHESDWGITQYGRRPGGSLRMSQHGQPNILNLKFQPMDNESGWKELMTWRVPIDDTYHVAYLVNYVNVTGEAAERYKSKMIARNEALKKLEPGHLIAERVLKGELSIKDILDRPDLLEIQDHIAQGSQGVIADRDSELLGRSDVLVVLLRRIWAREMKAMAEGRPMKQWVRSVNIKTTTGLEKT
jgi:5,5'-dehydrodivanillate O-demethylase oxygenase subunit